jgi:hypothetical protein
MRHGTVMKRSLDEQFCIRQYHRTVAQQCRGLLCMPSATAVCLHASPSFFSMKMHSFVCVCIYIYIYCIYLCRNRATHTRGLIQHIKIHAYIHTHIYTLQKSSNAHTRTGPTHKDTYMHTYIRYIHAYIHTHIYTLQKSSNAHTRTGPTYEEVQSDTIKAGGGTREICICICMHTHVICACVCVCVHIHMYAYTCGIFAHIHIHNIIQILHVYIYHIIIHVHTLMTH